MASTQPGSPAPPSSPVLPARDLGLVLAAKTARTFCYGFLGVLLPVYLADLGMNSAGVGLSVTLTLVGSAVLTWSVRRPVERWGARASLLALSGLSVVAAVLFLAGRNPWLVVLGAMLGNVAVGTGETGPFLSIEQVVVTRATRPDRRTLALSVYNLAGYAAAALGSIALRFVPDPRPLFAVFLAAALLQGVLFSRLAGARIARPAGHRGIFPASPVIRRIAALFSLDSFAGGFIVQSLIAYWFHVRFGMDLASLGTVFFAAQLVTALSLLAAPPLARRFGLLNTMVATHFTSSTFLVAMAFSPSGTVAVAFLLLRQLLSQMDVPTRQAYLMAVVEDHEREEAAISTTLARTVTQAVSPAITGWVMQGIALSAPLVVGGGLKMLYDVLIYFTFRKVPLRPDGG
jgi:MFS family permease